jgi:hypothetical protein
VFFGIVHPEVMALSVGIADVRTANALYLVQQSAVGQSSPAQFSPLAPPTAGDHVVDSSEGEALMVEMAMQHDEQHTLTMIDKRIICEQGDTVLRFLVVCALRSLQAFPTNFYEYPSKSTGYLEESLVCGLGADQ